LDGAQNSVAIDSYCRKLDSLAKPHATGDPELGDLGAQFAIQRDAPYNVALSQLRHFEISLRLKANRAKHLAFPRTMARSLQNDRAKS